MAGAVANLSGSGPQQVYVWLSYVSYNQGGNFSTWYWEVVYKQNGGLQWMSDNVNSWSLSGFAVGGGSFGIPSSWAGGGDYMLGNGYFTKGHDSNGYLPAQTMYASISSPHGNIGSGTAGVNSVAVQIPRTPPAPSVAGYGFDQITSDSARYRFSSTGDGGSPITAWRFELATNPAFTGAVVYTSSGTTLLTGLTPGTTYYARAWGENAVGAGAKSAVSTMTTLPGVYVSDGVNWVGAPSVVSDGSAWLPLVPKISTGSAWEDPD